MNAGARRFVLACLILSITASSAGARQSAALPSAADTTRPQNPVWKVQSVVGLQIAQASFSNSWAGNDVGSLSWILGSNTEVERRLGSFAVWNNKLELQFGQTHQQDRTRGSWLAPTKSSDKISYRGIVRYTLGIWVDPFTALDLDSQFFQQSAGTPRLTRLFTPTRISESAGVARAFWNTQQRQLVSRLGIAMRENIDRLAPAAGTSGFDTDTSVDGGLEWFTNWGLAAGKRTIYKAELRVFKALATSENDAVKRRHWTAPDVDWQNTLSNRVTDWLAFNLFWQLRYDKQTDLRGPFKQTTGVGFTWQML